MPPKTMITAWSFSRYMDYRKCPAKARYKHLLRLPEPSNAAMERGNTIHKMAEDYIKGKIRVMPFELTKFKALFVSLKALYKKKLSNMTVEDTWAFTKDWVQTRYDDWANCWVRIKLDCASFKDKDPDTLIIRDWKTGKFREEQNADYVEQLELYVVGAMYTHKHVKTAIPQLVYLDQGTIYPTTPTIYTRKDLPMLVKTWEARIKPMLSDTVFAPRPSDECRWCHYSKAKGGPCQF